MEEIKSNVYKTISCVTMEARHNDIIIDACSVWMINILQSEILILF